MRPGYHALSWCRRDNCRTPIVLPAGGGLLVALATTLATASAASLLAGGGSSAGAADLGPTAAALSVTRALSTAEAWARDTATAASSPASLSQPCPPLPRLPVAAAAKGVMASSVSWLEQCARGALLLRPRWLLGFLNQMEDSCPPRAVTSREASYKAWQEPCTPMVCQKSIMITCPAAGKATGRVPAHASPGLQKLTLASLSTASSCGSLLSPPSAITSSSIASAAGGSSACNHRIASP